MKPRLLSKMNKDQNTGIDYRFFNGGLCSSAKARGYCTQRFFQDSPVGSFPAWVKRVVTIDSNFNHDLYLFLSDWDKKEVWENSKVRPNGLVEYQNKEKGFRVKFYFGEKAFLSYHTK